MASEEKDAKLIYDLLARERNAACCIGCTDHGSGNIVVTSATLGHVSINKITKVMANALARCQNMGVLRDFCEWGVEDQPLDLDMSSIALENAPRRMYFKAASLLRASRFR